MTATSTALSQCDIILEIVGHLTPPPVYDIERRRCTKFWSPEYRQQSWYGETDAKARREALARLARTCRAFSEHALKGLWAAPPGGLYTVLSLLSAFGYTEETSAPQRRRFSLARYTYGHRRYNLDGAVPPHEWATFTRYAARIRAIGYHTFEGPYFRFILCDTVFDVLSNINGEVPLFPNLRFLAWQRGSPCNETDPTGARIIRMLTSPSLSALALWHPMRPHGHPFAAGWRGGYTCKSEVEAFVVSFPNLQHVAVDVNLGHPLDLLSLTELRRLQTLVLGSVDLDFLQHFGPLEDLRMLECELRTEDAYWDDESQTEIPARTPSLPAASLFPKLTRVVLEGPTPLVVNLLSSFSSDTLSFVDIRLELRNDCSVIPVFLNALCPPRTLLSLTTVKLYIPLPISGPQQLRPQLRFVTVAEPLLHLRRLEVLQFVVRDRILNISDNDITQMTRAWPHIVALNITYHDRNQIDGMHPSLRALVGLSGQCRALESLKIDVRDVSEYELEALEEDVTTCAEPQTSLVNLVLVRGGDTATLLLPDVTRLASALHALFPHLEGCGVLMPDERRQEEIADSDVRKGEAGELLIKLDLLQKERRHRSS